MLFAFIRCRCPAHSQTFLAGLLFKRSHFILHVLEQNIYRDISKGWDWAIAKHYTSISAPYGKSTEHPPLPYDLFWWKRTHCESEKVLFLICQHKDLMVSEQQKTTRKLPQYLLANHNHLNILFYGLTLYVKN